MTTALKQRWGVLAGVVVGLAGFADLAPFEPSGPVLWILPLAALVYPVCAVLRRRPVPRQLAGVLLFAGVAAGALALDPAVGQYWLAAGWAGHAAWDFAHRDGTVVPRWYTDLCLPLDLLVAGSLVLAATTIG